MKMAHTPTTENLTRLRNTTTLVLDPRLENSAALQLFLWKIAVLWGNMHMSFFPQSQGVLDAGRVWAVDAIFSIYMCIFLFQLSPVSFALFDCSEIYTLILRN